MPASFSLPLEKQELRINTIEVKVVVGVDMTELKADAYCNPTNSDLDLETGAVAKQLRNKGGSKFEQACCNTKTTDGVAVTDSGTLNSNYVIHLNIHHRGSWADKILKVLKEADRLGIISIVIPACGTGAGGCDPDEVSQGIFEAVAQYGQGDAPTIKEITIVVYETSMAESFQMAKLEKLPQSSNEYQDVLKTVKQTAPSTSIKEIFKIKQPILSARYHFTKRRMQKDETKAYISIEKSLFHGTDSNAAQLICNTGFMIAAEIKNGRYYGNGIYVARDASYSLRYAKRILILSDVLTGRSEDVGPNDRCSTPPGIDSFRAEDGQIYVLFEDAQLLPKYLITL